MRFEGHGWAAMGFVAHKFSIMIHKRRCDVCVSGNEYLIIWLILCRPAFFTWPGGLE